MGTLRWQLWLDHLIEYLADRNVSSLDTSVRIALRLGLYQLRFLERVPAAAAVNESVNLVRWARLRSAEGFVNAVLRRATREPDFEPASRSSDPLMRLAIQTSHPPWLIERWIKNFGTQETEALAAANNQPAPVAFRIVDSSEQDEILMQLTNEGATLTPSTIAKNAWRINGGGERMRELSGSGKIYLQDEASQLVAEVLDAQPGDWVLDVCAAPGGKATQIAATSSTVRVVATDLHEHRVRTVVNATRLQGIKNVQYAVLDGEQNMPFTVRAFDRVLVDAPCSGTGTFRHNPEIRWRISAEDIRHLAGRQKKLLQNASHSVKPGGRLVYSTCSVEPEENEEVVAAFLAGATSFRQSRLKLADSLITASGQARTWPQQHGVDGFFIAAFEAQ